MTSKSIRVLAVLALALVVTGCKKTGSTGQPAGAVKIGLVTDVGGRGDQSFNDGALRGLESWAAGQLYTPRGYEPLDAEARKASIPEGLPNAAELTPLAVAPVVLQAKQQEDYAPNLQILIDDGVRLAIGVGFMLENAVEQTAKANPDARFLLIDSPLLDSVGHPFDLTNVKTITFREQEGSFLVGALAGLVTKSNRVGFVGGMQIPLIRRFEVGFRAGVMTTNPAAGRDLLVGYTGSFDKVEAGKQVAQDMISKDADVIFHAAGADGLGAIAAAREAGRWAIGCDSDQHHVAPETVLTSMIKRVDLAVYLATRDVVQGRFAAGHSELGLKDGGLGYAPLRTDKLPNQEAILAQVEALRAKIVAGTLRVPANLTELARFTPPVAEVPAEAPAAAAVPAAASAE